LRQVRESGEQAAAAPTPRAANRPPITKAVQWSQEQTETIDQDEDGGVTTIVRTIQNRVLVVPSDKIDADTAAAVASVTLTASGTLAVKMHDKIAALRALSDRFRQSEVAPQQFNPNVPFIDAPPPETREQWLARQARIAEEERQRREDEKSAPQ
jgi:hypothetical protein